MSAAVTGVPQVMVFAADPFAMAGRWAEALDAPREPGDGGALLSIAGVELLLHPVDLDENPPAASTVGYRQVGDLDVSREALLAPDCDASRGLLERDDGPMCQVRDPSGTVWGLDSA